MDRLIYTAMTGMKHTMEKQGTVSHNLSNATTTGFRSQLNAFRAIPVVSEGKPTRTFVVDSTVGTDFSAGALQHTGRAYDVAIQNKGWLTVQMPDGTEAYTRHGSLEVSPNGILQTRNGLPVLSNAGGPIAIPPDVKVVIAKDGTVSTVDETTSPKTVANLAIMKLVNPPENELVRGEDGLFRQKSGLEAEADPGVAVVNGALESSNVNVADTLVNMISVARQFELQVSLLKNAENNAARATQILSLSS